MSEQREIIGIGIWQALGLAALILFWGFYLVHWRDVADGCHGGTVVRNAWGWPTCVARGDR